MRHSSRLAIAFVILGAATAAARGAAAPASARRPMLQALPGGEDARVWRANAWGGGRIVIRDDRSGLHGEAATRADFQAIEGKVRGNAVGPSYEGDARWRSVEWGALALWYRTTPDEHPRALLVTDVDSSGRSTTFTRALPPARSWTRLVLTPAMFWNRDRRKLDLRRLGRIMISASTPGTVWIGRVSLVAPHRVVPLHPAGTQARLLEVEPGRYLVENDVAAEVRWSATLRLPGAAPAKASAGPGGFAEVHAEPGNEGVGRLTLSTHADARELSFDALLPSDPGPTAPLGLVPTPKRFRRLEGALELASGLAGEARAGGSSLPALESHLRESYGVVVRLRDVGGAAGVRWIRLGEVDLPAPPSGPHPEAYSLRVSRTGAAIVSRDQRGLFYGVISLLQLIDATTTPGAAPRAPAVEVEDWPDLPVRGLLLTLPTERRSRGLEVSPADFTRFLERVVVRRKLNVVVVEGLTGVRLDAAPEVASPSAWTKEQLRTVLDFLRRNEVEVVPCLPSLGHMSWLLAAHPELAAAGARIDATTGAVIEVPDLRTLDTSNPEAWPLLMRIYGELIDLFQPRFFHVGLDEVRWQTHLLPPERRSPGHDVPDRKWEFARWARRLHGALAARGVRAMMWADMLAPQHNGGAPYHVADALSELPRDMIMLDWSAEQDPLHAWNLRQAGFEDVWEGNSTGVTRARGKVVAGALAGLWTRTPWLDEFPKEANPQSWQTSVHAAEFFWRRHPSLALSRPKVERRFFEDTAGAEAALLFEPEPAAAADPVIPLGPARGPAVRTTGWFLQGEASVKLRDVEVPVWTDAMRGGAVLPVGRKAAAIYFLQALDVNEAMEAALRERLGTAETTFGVPVAEYEIVYGDGQTERAAMRFGYDVRGRRAADLPHTYAAAVRLLRAPHGGDTALYLRQWVNPRPDQTVESVRLVSLIDPGGPLVLGAALRQAREPLDQK